MKTTLSRDLTKRVKKKKRVKEIRIFQGISELRKTTLRRDLNYNNIFIWIFSSLQSIFTYFIVTDSLQTCKFSRTNGILIQEIDSKK